MGPAECRDRGCPRRCPVLLAALNDLAAIAQHGGVGRTRGAPQTVPQTLGGSGNRAAQAGGRQAKHRTGVKAEQVLPEMGDGLTFRAEEKQGGLVGSGWGLWRETSRQSPPQGGSQEVPGRAPGDWVWAAQGLDQCRARGVARWWPCRGGECWACRHPAAPSGAVQCGCSAEPAGALGKGRLQPGGCHLQGARRGPQRPGHCPGPSAGEGQARGARLLS